ncbi:MAG: ABC transporter permease [Bifidobacteriaceae bacterium]|jgi:ABC-type dipeptide/oligopeptide/nickel transport system permease subunit|nr:ABC transporter permease [Bifidobacteriaceae bacterium]
MATTLSAPTTAAPAKKQHHFHVPGWAFLKSTHGLQRVILVIGLVICAVFVICALCARWIAPYGFAQRRDANGVLFPSQDPPSAAHIWGTTVAGMDVFSRVIWGSMTALQVVLLAVILSLIVGVALGVISGYIGGWLDRVLVLITDALYAFPSLLLAIIVSIVVSGGSSSAFGGIVSAATSITVVFIPQYFRVVRNATLSMKSAPFVDAARVAGAKPGRIMFGHILANVSQTIPVLLTLNCSEAILTLAGLGFLGFGIEPTAAAEWGYDLNKALNDANAGIWWSSVFPGAAIVIVVMGVALVGESMNDVLNPLLRTRGGAVTTADEMEVAAALAQATGGTDTVVAVGSPDPATRSAGRGSGPGGPPSSASPGAAGTASSPAKPQEGPASDSGSTEGGAR